METILLIEDEQGLAVMAQMVLLRRGAKVFMARNVREARDIWSELREEITLVMADEALPDGSGVELARTLKAEKASLRIVISSGAAPAGLPKDFELLHKPYDLQELSEVIRAAKESGRD